MSHSEAAVQALDARLEIAVGAGAQRFSLTAQLTLTSGVLVLFGPSGCGKSLSLQAIVGTVRPDAGHVRVNGRPLFDDDVWVPPHQRNIGYVPQHHSLFPFCSVRENIAFGLPRARRKRRDDAVEALIEELSLGHIAKSMPAQLSGGERQRVALARALVVRPSLLVLDEPFASLDTAARQQLHDVLRRTLTRHGTPALFVTHDPYEALALGDEMVRFERGRTVEQGPCAQLMPLAQTLSLRDLTAEPLEQLVDGRRRYRIREAILEGPDALLESGATRQNELTLRLVAKQTDES